MEEINFKELSEKLKQMNSSEILPPLISDGIEKVIGIGLNKNNNTITITYCECVERVGHSKYKAPEYYKTEQITMPIQLLSWLSPRLEGYRESLGIDNSFNKKTGSADR